MRTRRAEQASRTAALAAAARRFGMEFSAVDHFGLAAFPVSTQRVGRCRSANVAWGQAGAMPFRLFDAWGDGVAFSGAVAHVPANAPDLVIAPRSEAGPAWLPEVTVWVAGLDTRWCVHAADPRVADVVLGGDLAAWLAIVEPRWRFELSGQWAICLADPVEPDDLPDLVDTLHDFWCRIPPAVSHRWPRAT